MCRVRSSSSCIIYLLLVNSNVPSQFQFSEISDQVTILGSVSVGWIPLPARIVNIFPSSSHNTAPEAVGMLVVILMEESSSIADVTASISSTGGGSQEFSPENTLNPLLYFNGKYVCNPGGPIWCIAGITESEKSKSDESKLGLRILSRNENPKPIKSGEGT